MSDCLTVGEAVRLRCVRKDACSPCTVMRIYIVIQWLRWGQSDAHEWCEAGLFLESNSVRGVH